LHFEEIGVKMNKREKYKSLNKRSFNMSQLKEKPYVSNQIADFGPVLTDEEFFAELDGKIPELFEAKSAYSRGEALLSYKLFTDYIKNTLNPKLFFTSRGKEIKPEFTEKLKGEVDLVMKHYFTVLGTPMQFGEEIDWLANPTPNNYAEWRIHLQYHSELVTLATAYRATGDEKYAKELTKLLTHWIINVPRCAYDSGSYGPTHTWRTLECGVRANNWMEMLHSIIDSPSFTDEFCVTVYKSLFEHQMRMTLGYTHGNWLFVELGGVATLTAISPVFEKSREWREDVERRLMRSLESMVYPDGWEYELAPGYMGVCLGNTRNIEQTYHAYGYPMPDRIYEIMNSMADCYVKATMANGTVPPINDSYTMPCKDLVKRHVELYGGSAEAKWFATDKQTGNPPEYNSILMPYAGFVSLRTGWGEGDVSAFFDAGKYGRDHFHDDKLNLLIYNSKKSLIVECGSYHYDISMMRNYCVNTEGHNTVMVDGLGQCRFEGHWENPAHWAHTKEDALLIERDTFDYARGAYRENYGVFDYSKLKRPEVKGRQLAEHVREVIMVKKPVEGKPYFVAIDTMTDKVGKSHTYDCLWHIDAEEVRIENERIVAEDITLFALGFDSIKCYKGSEEPFQGWITRSGMCPRPCIVATKSGENASFMTLLAPGAEDEVTVIGAELIGGTLKVMHKGGKADEIDLSLLRGEA
jgi:hypothetical protein